jgi:hypothetical protein
VLIGGVEQKAHFFVLDLPHSDACYVRAYPARTAEAWIDGHKAAPERPTFKTDHTPQDWPSGPMRH